MLLVLAFAARVVSRRLARPLEDVASAAERFGRGDLTARTQLGRPRRDSGRWSRGGRRYWVAEEVRGVANAFDTMAERIARVVRDQRELLGAISHELRSPLGRARVALEIARDRAQQPQPTVETVSDAQILTFDAIDRQLSEVDAILGDLLAAARAGLSDLRPHTTSLLPWLRARIAAEIIPPMIELTAPDDEVLVSLEAALMNRAIHNVFANARAHGHPPDRPLEVHVEADTTRVRIAVRDHGPGFPPEILARAFDPFVKGDAARTPLARAHTPEGSDDAETAAGANARGGGVGLGLALVRRIVEAHGGNATAQNVVEDDRIVGAEVALEIPRVRDAGR